MTSAARVLALPTLVTPDDVQAQLQCSRSEAYAHLRACAVRYKRGKGAAVVQHAPVVLRVVRAGG